MNNGIWKTICLCFTAVSLLLCSSRSDVCAQDNFREFDRKMVATPAELYEMLSIFNPTKSTPEQIDPKRLEELEKAGRDVLSKMTPQQQEKLWEFAEKFLRKDGVDASSKKKLMQKFGLPPELQNELAEQFRKYGGQLPDSDANEGGEAQDDRINQLLSKARERFREANLRNKDENGPKAVPIDGAVPTAKEGAEQTNSDSSRATRARTENGSKIEKDSSGQNGGRTRGERAGVTDSPTGSPQGGLRKTLDANQQRTGRNSNSSNSRRTDGTRPGNPMDFQPGSGSGKGANADDEIERLMKRLGGLQKELDQTRSAPGADARARAARASSDADWEALVKKLAEDDGGESGKSGLEKAQDLLSGAFDPGRKSGRRNTGSPAGSGKAGKPNESVGTQFDRLLVKAVDRTLSSPKEEGVSEGVGGMLGNLIERFQDKAKETSKKRERRAGGSKERKFQNTRRGSPPKRMANSNRSSQESGSRSESGDSGFQPEFSSTPETPSPSALDMSPGKLFENLPDLSSINPTQVFTFFAIVGVVLFVGYLLTQSFSGDLEATIKRREVIKQVRNRTIRSPKDLVETVDMFLLAKFGIKSSWWNAALAQRVLNSGSSGLKERVDELFRDYVRARYMRDDIEIPSADQQGYKSALEELSKLDIKPEPKLHFRSLPTETKASLEG